VDMGDQGAPDRPPRKEDLDAMWSSV